MLTEKDHMSPYDRRDSQDLEQLKNLPEGTSLTRSRVGSAEHFNVDSPPAQFQSQGVVHGNTPLVFVLFQSSPASMAFNF